MKHRRNCLNSRSFWPLALAPLSGCGVVGGAPSYTVVGSFFPAWMFCGVFGIFVAIGARAAFVSLGLANVLPYQLFFCTAIGLTAAMLVWLLWFGQ